LTGRPLATAAAVERSPAVLAMSSCRCVIVANPAARRLQRSQPRRRLERLAGDLGCPLLGLDCGSPADFRQCVAAVSKTAEVVLVAGGDGTFADALNALCGDPILGFVPCGSGNALRWALRQAGAAPVTAATVARRRSRRIGVMLCDGTRKALLAGVGLDALVCRHYQAAASPAAALAPTQAGGAAAPIGGRRGGFARYALAVARAAGEYRRPQMWIGDGAGRTSLGRCLGVIVGKQPYYGYGLRVNRGGLAEPSLWLRAVRWPAPMLPVLLAMAACGRWPRPDVFATGDVLTVHSSEPAWLQCDGEAVWQSRRFVFELLPAHVRLLM